MWHTVPTHVTESASSCCTRPHAGGLCRLSKAAYAAAGHWLRSHLLYWMCVLGNATAHQFDDRTMQCTVSACSSHLTMTVATPTHVTKLLETWLVSPDRKIVTALKTMHVVHEATHQITRSSREPSSQLLPLRSHSHRTVVGVTHPSHDAASCNHGHCAEAELVTPQSCRDQHIPPATHAPIHSQSHSVSELVGNQGLQSTAQLSQDTSISSPFCGVSC